MNAQTFAATTVSVSPCAH